MRVELYLQPDSAQPAAEIPWRSADGTSEFFDLRDDPRLIAKIEPARQHAPLRNFLVAVNEPDSLFFTAWCKTRSEDDASPEQEQRRASESGAQSQGHTFATQVELAFALEALNRTPEHFAEVARQLSELLAREAGADSLAAQISLRNCRYTAAGHQGFLLRIELRASGATSEQAELRCGLGLARVQQALLFTSRTLRQKLGGGEPGAGS